MKKIIAILGAIVILTCTLTSCATTTIQITPENFEQYFEISVTTDDFEGGGLESFAGMPFISSSTVNVTISIIPKQTVSSGSVSVVLEDDNLIGWNCEYSTKTTYKDGTTMSDGLRIPIQFSPNQPYTKTFEMKDILGGIKPHIVLEVAEASGTIKI